MVVHVCQQAAKAESVARVVVATDSPEIAEAVRAHRFEAVMTSADHPNGTSRLAEATQALKLHSEQAVINVQGDEPEIEPRVIDSALLAMSQQVWPFERPSMYRLPRLGTVATPLQEAEDIGDSNIVKVVLGLIEPDMGVGRALYFSRAAIPYDRDDSGAAMPLRHMGIYAYDVFSLEQYMKLPPTPLEESEKLEQLRWLEHGLPIAVAVRRATHQGIDTPEQYAAFVERYRAGRSGLGG
jgi:3-deoxy-manno-octulosonate cytidylyltransferase (CMP-KDO synthetase)